MVIQLNYSLVPPSCENLHRQTEIDQELITVKTAIEEWRHWLEEALHPFTVFTDDRNLADIRLAKCLNTRQVHWSLFFTRF